MFCSQVSPYNRYDNCGMTSSYCYGNRSNCMVRCCRHCLLTFRFNSEHWTVHRLSVIFQIKELLIKLCQNIAQVRFLPRDAMHSADYAVARYLSVCSSVTRRYSVEMDQLIIKLFSPSGKHTILVFAAPNIMAITGALNARDMKKIAIFDQYVAISGKWYKIRP